MNKVKGTIPNPELVDAENPEWTDEMFKAAKRIADLPEGLQHKLKRPGTRGPQKNQPKFKLLCDLMHLSSITSRQLALVGRLVLMKP